MKHHLLSVWITLLLMFVSGVATGQAQNLTQKQVTITQHQVTLTEFFNEMNKQTGLNFIYNSDQVKTLPKVTVQEKNASAKTVLDKVLNSVGCTYTVQNNVVTVKKKGASNKTRHISGVVTDDQSEPLVGVSIKNSASNAMAITNQDGNFDIEVPTSATTVTMSYVGMKATNIKLSAGQNNQKRNVVMESAIGIDEVVVTGIFNRKKESFTGSAATYNKEELLTMGSSNVLQSLKTLDPAFAVIEDTQFGSDPNRMPNMEIRGKSSMLGQRDALESDPNQPLFILDGFESTLEAINDIDINRIESITILKDAASTAIYGSKAANGVVVVETVKPTPGKLQVNYTGNFNMSIPDLSSYNMMDAAEKIEFERRAGRYDSSIVETANQTTEDITLSEMYYNRLNALAQGVNSDWVSEPVRTGVSQKHSLYVQGGNENFMFGIGGQYHGTKGVMKQSQRDVYSGNLDLIYRVKKFQFSNKLTVSDADYSNPTVSFNEFVQTNPYYKKYNDDGSISQWLEYTDDTHMANPLWNSSLNSYNKGNDFTLSNYFQAEWTPNDDWKARARFGITYTDNGTQVFTSPENTDQVLTKAANLRGEYARTTTKGLQYEGDFSVTYAHLFNEIHRINAVIGGNIYHYGTTQEGYEAEGFPAGDFTLPSFASGYIADGVPTYVNSTSRSANAYLNAGYALMDRYLLDVSLRENGSSVFGSTKKWSETWSVGLGWNIHKEAFMQNVKWVNYFKIRGSIGNPGNQSFDSGRTLVTYTLQPGSVNYFGLAALPNQVGNPNLEWQITQDKNVGLDLTLFNSRLSFTVDYYHKVTDPLLIGITMPLSSGTTSYYTNAGQQTSQGLNFSANYYIIKNLGKRIMWNIRVTGRTQSNKIDGIGNKLDAFNNSGRGTSTTRYFDGADPDDIWVVKSAGIDPSTGKELFYDLNGNYTYDYSYDNEQVCGNTRPDLEGVIGTSFTFGGFSMSVNFRYQLGADVFNTALWNKVENIDYLYNQDKRALYDRWNNVGDIAPFKDVRDYNPSPMTSRFIQNEKTLTLESVHLEYQFFNGWIKKLRLGNLKVFVDARDLVRLSTIKAERGTSYPYARTIEGGLSFNL